MTPEQYATADDGAQLHWTPIIIQDGNKHPAVICIPGGQWKQLANVPTTVSNALFTAGYNVFNHCEYRTVPPGHLIGQTSNGQFPNQTDDCALAVATAAKDGRCNGEVFIVGGSAGAYEALWLAAKGLVKASVCFSPPTQLDDVQSLTGMFGLDVKNYAPGHYAEASPNNQLTATSSPVFIRSFEEDHIPPRQYTIAVKKLAELGIENDCALLPGAGHAWDCTLVAGVLDQAAAFLNAYRGPPSK